MTGVQDAWVPFEFDQAHVLHLTGGVVLPWNIHLSLGFHLNTGRPESGIISSRAMRPGLEGGSLLPTWVPETLTHEPRLPTFARRDARVSRTWVVESFTLEGFLDVFNASATSEVLGYTYLVVPSGKTRTLQRQAFSLPIILPFFGLKARY